MEKIKQPSFIFETVMASDDWRRLLKNFSNYDFVHTYDIHNVSQINGEGEPILFSVMSLAGDCVLLWPALKRVIPGTTSYDLGSVYGYGGPLISRNLSSNESADAFECLFDGMAREGFVSLFSRMHPLFADILPSEVKGDILGDVVMIDVKKNTQNILMGYRVSHRYEIKKSIKNGVVTFVEYGSSAFNDFVKIYHEAMSDLRAADYYLFSSEYFNCLKKSKDFNVFVIYANYDGNKISAAIFIVTKNIMHYFLSGTIPKFRDLSASKVILARAHELAIHLGVTQIILGGGVGCREDALLEFKKGFSKSTAQFRIFKKILNPALYKEICDKKRVVSKNSNFFPEYRSPDICVSTAS
jgi:hypothetical protein